MHSISCSRVWVSNSIVGLSLLCSAARAQQIVKEVHGDQAGQFLGWGASLVADLDGDGCDDFVVGSPLRDTAAGADSGRIAVHSGKTGSVLFTVDGPAPDTWFGQVAQEAGDTNLDGFVDVLVGAVRDDDTVLALNNAGSVTLISGSNGQLLRKHYGQLADDSIGIAVTGLGDIDLDGVTDYAYGGGFADGSNGVNCGRIWARSGASGAVLYSFQGDAPNDTLGVCAGGGDVDGDGIPDIVGGARWDDDHGTDCGSARVWSGATGAIVHTWFGDAPGDNLGNVVSGGADVDGDGCADPVVGIWRADVNGSNSGSVRQFSGDDGSILHAWHGDSAGDGFGVFVDEAGDVDGDAIPDVVIGAFQDDSTLTNAGSLWVFSGADGAEIFHVYGEGNGDELGVICHGHRDVDGNGFDDVISGAYWNDEAGSNTGAAYVYSACAAKVLEYGTGCPGSGGFVPRLRLLGCPVVASSVTLALDQALGGTTGLLFFGVGEGHLRVPGDCRLLVAPVLPLIPVLPIAGNGAGQGGFAVPATIPSDAAGITLTLQMAILDAGAAYGFAMTEGVLLEIH